MAAPEFATRCRAELRRVVDADTYVLLVDLEQTKFEQGAKTMHVRLRDFSAPEKNTAAGKAAIAVANEVLRLGPLSIELLGARSMDRSVGWLWAGDVAVGPELVARGAAKPGAFMGDGPAAVRPAA